MSFPTTPRPQAGVQPRVAVVIPCYNDGETLLDTVGSVRAQTPCELVVVDDGSDDQETLRILQTLEEDGQRVLRLPNSGPSAARTAGVDATTAPYIFALDADDLVVPGAISALADALDREPAAVMAWGDVQTFGSAHLYKRGPARLDRWLITYLNELVGPSALLRREALMEVGGWRLRHGYESWDLWLSFVERGWGGIYLPIPVLQYRLHGPRRLATAMERHDELQRDLRRRHEGLFGSRRSTWLRSSAPLHLRLTLPLLDALPLLSARNKLRIGAFFSRPLDSFSVRLARHAPGIAEMLRGPGP